MNIVRTYKNVYESVMISGHYAYTDHSANLESVVNLYQSLIEYANEIRTEGIFQKFIDKAK